MFITTINKLQQQLISNKALFILLLRSIQQTLKYEE